MSHVLHAATWPRDIVAKLWADRPLPEQRECCTKHPTEDYIDWNECVMQPLMSPGFTDTGLKQIAASCGLQPYIKLLKVRHMLEDWRSSPVLGCITEIRGSMPINTY
jgi:hypothetical protein